MQVTIHRINNYFQMVNYSSNYFFIITGWVRIKDNICVSKYEEINPHRPTTIIRDLKRDLNV